MTGALACLNITVSAGTVTFATGTSPTLDIRGSMSLLAGTVWSSTGNVTFSSTYTGRTVTTNGTTINAAVTFNGAGGGWTLGSALNIGGNQFSMSQGTFDTSAVGNYSLTCGRFNSSVGFTRTINLNASTITLTFSSLVIDILAGLTFNVGTSTFVVTGQNPTFNGSGLTFYNLTFTNSTLGIAAVTGTNTFNNFTVTGPLTSLTAFTNTVTFNARQTINGT
jgi:hypothetical protein